ncbi:hypothetical protein SLS58_003114 [Diplodia intermedia]|uniref:BTB domain-containing protein n=1 Tax=Diplodia intermedia TaxID=856260 RepID=A0ABR3TX72_9PEZI
MPPIEREKPAEAEEDKENLISLRRDLEKAFKSGENCDMAIALNNGETIECHRAILCNRSTFFANALKPGRFKARPSPPASNNPCVSCRHISANDELRAQEGTTGTIEFLDDPPTAIKALVEFLYTADYKVTTVKRKQRYTKKEKQEASDTLLHIAEVYAVAAVYDAPQLMRRMHTHFHAFYALVPYLSTFICALSHIFNWVPEDQCLIRRDGHFLKACMKYLYLDSGERENVRELIPDFFTHLDKHAWKLIEDDCDNWALNWLGEVREVISLSVTNCHCICPRCSREVYVEFPSELYGCMRCPLCGVRVRSSEWNDGMCESDDEYEQKWDTESNEWKDAERKRLGIKLCTKRPLTYEWD